MKLTTTLEWYRDRNPLSLGATVYVSLVPALAVAGAVCMVGVLTAIEAASPSGDLVSGGLSVIPAYVLGFILSAALGAIFTTIVGFVATAVVSLVDISFGRVLSPVAFGASSVGLAVIPIALSGIIAQAYSTYPESDVFMYFYYTSVVSVGSLAGALRLNVKADSGDTSGRSRRWSIWQILALAVWVVVACVVGLTDVIFLSAAGIFVAFVFAAVCVCKLFRLGTAVKTVKRG